MEGYIKFYNPMKGFGFIKSEEKEYFFHISDVDREDANSIEQEVKVEFETTPHPKGEKAINVKVIK